MTQHETEPNNPLNSVTTINQLYLFFPISFYSSIVGPMTLSCLVVF